MSQTEVGFVRPSKLLSYFGLHAGKRAKARRRTVLARSPDGQWLLVSCVVEAFPDPSRMPKVQSPRRYANVELHEDWLTPQACLSFVEGIQNGSVSLAEQSFAHGPGTQWFGQTLPPSNFYMSRPGFIARIKFEDRQISFDQGLLLAEGQPYYPDLVEAARDWLGLLQYHGSSDGCNSHILFLLPESRAYFTAISSNGDATTFTVGGLSHAQRKLTIKAAYWQGTKISHAEASIRAGRATLSIPQRVSRLDCVLIDTNGEIFDRHYEGMGSHSGIVRTSASNENDRLAELVRSACRTGENQTTEFKPFIRLDDTFGTSKDPTKYRELLRTVVSFSNSDGGQAYLGISDACVIEGIEINVQAWGQAKYSPAVGERYSRALLQKIRGDIRGEFQIEIDCVTVDGVPIAVIEIQPTATPICIVGDNHLYRRVGATSMQIAPSQWATLGPQNLPDQALLSG